MPILYIHGVSHREGETEFGQDCARLFAKVGIPASELVPVYWGDHASKLPSRAADIKSLPLPWNRELGPDALVDADANLPTGLLSVTPMLRYLDPRSPGLVTMEQVEAVLSGDDQLLDIEEPARRALGLYAKYQATFAVDRAFELAAVAPAEADALADPPDDRDQLLGFGDNPSQEDVKRKMSEVIAEGLAEGATGNDYSRGLLNFNLRDFLGNAVAGIVGNLVQIGGVNWAMRWLARKLTQGAYKRWLKNWVISTMAWLNQKVTGFLDVMFDKMERVVAPAVGNFLGDVFAYLRDEREEIQEIVRARYEEARQMPGNSKLYIVAHSLGGLIAFDLCINRGGHFRDDTKTRKIDKLITFGSQVGLFQEIDPAPELQVGTDGLIDLGKYLGGWHNFYHEMDFLGFSANRVFKVGDASVEEQSVAYTGLVTTSADGAVLQIGADFQAEGFFAHSGYWRDEDFLPLLENALSDYAVA